MPASLPHSALVWSLLAWWVSGTEAVFQGRSEQLIQIIHLWKKVPTYMDVIGIE